VTGSEAVAFDFVDEEGFSFKFVVYALPRTPESGIIIPGDSLPAGDPEKWLKRVLVCLHSLDSISTEALESDPALQSLGQCFNDLGITLAQLFVVVKQNVGEARARSLVHGLANHVLDNTAIWARANDGTSVVVHKGDLAAAPNKESAD
jgi:hypothetical protein